MSAGSQASWSRRAAVAGKNLIVIAAAAGALATITSAAAQNGPAWPGDATRPASAPASGANQRSSATDTAVLRAPPPFTMAVVQSVPLEPREWDVLQLRELEARLVNAPDDAARMATAMELEGLRARMESDRAVVLLGRVIGGERGAAPIDAAVLVPAGLGGNFVQADTSVRVTPSGVPFPSSALGEATRAFPVLRLFGTAARPGYVADAIEPVATTAPARSLATDGASPWARRTATALAESANLVVEGAPIAGAEINGRVPMSVTVRNAGVTALPACEVFFEFMDGSGNLIHREFSWITPQQSEALEAHLPALAPGAQATIATPVPRVIAAEARSCRVLILRALAPSAN